MAENAPEAMDDESYSTEDLLGPLNEVEKRHAPKQLFVAGDTTLLRVGARVSVVGTRRASQEGRGRASRLAHLLVEHEMVVVSGLAEGIDTSAHRAAIEAGGRTIAVLGTPLDRFYPAKNRSLQEAIMREHLAVSQFPRGSSGGRRCFPMRNRTMALISDATVIVEAGEGSGTLHQGWEALRLGRPLFLTESVATDPGLSWPTEMRDYGAEVLSDRTLEFFFESLPEAGRGERAELAL
jgi:DNA processing protein